MALVSNVIPPNSSSNLSAANLSADSADLPNLDSPRSGLSNPNFTPVASGTANQQRQPGSPARSHTSSAPSAASSTVSAAAAPVEQQQQQPESLPQSNSLLSVGFNQDYGCFACGTDTGFRIYNCDPFKETFRREFNNGGIGLVEMLFRCNILAIVGGGTTPRYPPNKVMIWDDHQSRCIGELSFRSEIRAVRLRRDRIVVVLEHKIYVYNFADLKLLHQIETIANPKGLCALSPASTPSVLACPGLHKGQVRVEHYGLKKTKFIAAHETHLAAFALTWDGRLLATASSKGTLIRIFNTLDGTKLQELRRGVDRAEIYSIAFSPSGQWLALSSDKATVHVFSLRGAAGTDDMRGTDTQADAIAKKQNKYIVTSTGGSVTPSGGSAKSNGNGSGNGNGNGSPVAGSSPLFFASGNPGSSLSFMKGVLPKYFSSEWSFAQYRLPEETKAIVAFGPAKDTLIIVGTDGSFYKCEFDPVTGGEMKQQEYTKFMRPDEDTAL
ncbi:hypothetical protein R1sor_016906 [Riccia sorocarpa]|uniref:Uncharacterized protein n=1 Tax=Riccia sorocarpa TaxID=122646 RepID=A0ABD3HJN1_9MARC